MLSDVDNRLQDQKDKHETILNEITDMEEQKNNIGEEL